MCAEFAVEPLLTSDTLILALDGSSLHDSG
jgi:hypothetical protein